MLVSTTRWPLAWGRPKKKMLFVHTPKCGGKFVASAFGRSFNRCISLRHPDMRGHLTFAEYQKAFSRNNLNMADYQVFSVIRNPWQWQLSWYHYIRNDKDGKHSGMPIEHALLQRFSFLDYLQWLDEPLITGAPNQYYLKQVSDWVLDTSGQLGDLDVLRQETLDDDLKTLAIDHGVAIRPSRIRRNVSFRGDYRTEYCCEAVDIVARRHARDIEMFGYSFEGSGIA